MSAESGVATFRDEDTGLWSRFNPMALASVDGWHEDPYTAWGWYLWRIAAVRGAEPNAGHRALASWASHAEVTVVTQNIDDLHERAGSTDVNHLHGSLMEFRCADCHRPYADPIDVPDEPVEQAQPHACPHCGGLIRPSIVWFGEALPPGAMESAAQSVTSSDLVLVVGTSGIVRPAALLPFFAIEAGVPVIEINPEESAVSKSVAYSWRATAATALPLLVHAATGGVPEPDVE